MSRFSFARSGGIALLVLLGFVVAGWGVGTAAASHWAHHDGSHASDNGYQCEETGPPTSTRQCMGSNDIRTPSPQPSMEPYEGNDCTVDQQGKNWARLAGDMNGAGLNQVYAWKQATKGVTC